MIDYLRALAHIEHGIEDGLDARKEGVVRHRRREQTEFVIDAFCDFVPVGQVPLQGHADWLVY